MFSIQLAVPAFRCFGCLASLALLIGLGGCEQPQAVPTSNKQAGVVLAQPQVDLYYVDGQPSTKQTVEQLDTKTITRLDMLTGQHAMDYAHDAATRSVVLVHTK